MIVIKELIYSFVKGYGCVIHVNIDRISKHKLILSKISTTEESGIVIVPNLIRFSDFDTNFNISEQFFNIRINRVISFINKYELKEDLISILEKGILM